MFNLAKYFITIYLLTISNVSAQSFFNPCDVYYNTTSFSNGAKGPYKRSMRKKPKRYRLTRKRRR